MRRCQTLRVTAKPAPDENVWWSGLRWVDAAHMQIRRFEDALSEEAHAVADAEQRHNLNINERAEPRTGALLRQGQEPYDPQRPLRVPSFSLHMQVANELDLLGVAVRNVLRAQERIPEGRRPSMTGQEVLELLRNASEHWDEVGGPLGS